MSNKSRVFITAAVVASLVYGISQIAPAGEDAPPAPVPASTKKDEIPQWLKDARAEMKATGAPGIAIVLPEGKEAREKLRADLDELLRSADLSEQTCLMEAIYVVVPGDLAGAKDGETAVMLDADGKRVAGGSVSFEHTKFAADVRRLLRDGDRFAERVKAAKTAAFDKAVKELLRKDFDDWPNAAERMSQDFAATGPAIIDAWEREDPESESKQRLAFAIERAFARRRGDHGTEAERPLPFGTRWKQVREEPKEDPCPGCGMMMRRPRANDALELLAEAARTTK